MARIDTRVAALEARCSPAVVVHRLIVDGETREAALDRYGRDRIGVGDIVIVRTVVDPPKWLEGSA